jgi:outer membrane protein TolC
LAQVQHAQAMARYQSLQNDIQLAQQKLYSMTGGHYRELKSQPVEELSALALKTLLSVPVPGTAESSAEVALEHPTILQAKEQLKLAELGMTRAKSSYFPQVNLIVRNTQLAGLSDQYQGLQISFPTGVSAYGMQATARAQVDVDRARRALEEVQEQLRLERESTAWALKVNAQELIFRSSAVKVSEQNVASTEKAYEAGIVKASDVVNAILASFDVRRQKLLLLISMSEQQLLNALNRGMTSRGALEAVSHFFSE